MAVKRFGANPGASGKTLMDGFGQIELNNVAWRRDGRIVAQCALDPTDFATVPAENGMILAVDEVNRVVRFVDSSNDYAPVAVVYTGEHIYDERTPGLKNYATWIEGKDPQKRGFTTYPRLGYPAIGDKFTINAFSYNTTDFADDDAVVAMDLLKDTSPDVVYASEYAGGDGTWLITKTYPSTAKVIAKVVEATTMPDGQFAIKLQIINA